MDGHDVAWMFSLESLLFVLPFCASTLHPTSSFSMAPQACARDSVLLLLLASVLALKTAQAVAPCSVAGSTCKLSSDMKDWNKIPGFKGRERLWDRQMLDAGINNMGNLYHVKRLIDKLNSGKKITAIGFGSSMIHNFAGCWQTSVDALWSLGIVPNPMLYPQQGSAVPLEQWDFVWSKCSSGGYMEGFMETINSTWPNFNHIFLNNGKGGACLDMIIQGSCMSAYTPEEVDFVLLDTVTNLCDIAGSEKMVRHFLNRKSEPLVILISNGRVCMQQEPTNQVNHRCVADCLGPLSNGNHSAEVCRETAAWGDPFAEKEYREWSNVIRDYQKMAEHYDIAHLNHENLMKQLIDSGLNNTLHMSKWELTSEFYIDWVHYRKDRLGTLIVADLLMHYFEKAYQELTKMSEDQQNALKYTMPNTTQWPGAVHQHLSRCYGMSLKEILQKQPAPDDAKSTLTNFQPGDTFSGFVAIPGHDLKAPMSLPPLKIISSLGWDMQGYYRGQGGVVKYKPGWITHTPGSILEFEVNSVFDQLQPNEHAELVITYTVSYDKWGQAKISCVSGCVCNGGTIDAAVTDGSHTSLQRLFSFRVSQHQNCRVKVESLQSTASGGHKFKVSNILVRATVRL